MASRLKSVLNFVVPPAGVVVLPHGLNWQGRPVKPDLILPNAASDLAFTATTLTVTATNSGPQQAVVSVLTESWHTIERTFGDAAITALVPQPFIADGGSGGGVVDDAPVTTIVFRPGGVAGNNVYTTWATTYAALQSVAERGIVYLEFDTRFSPTVEPSTGIQSCVIPAGVWNMDNVTWTQTLRNPVSNASGRSFVELADGVSIVLTAPQSTLKIIGWNLTVFSNRVGPIAPFVGVNLILSGTRSHLRNTLLAPGALPAFEVGSSGSGFIVIDGSNSQGGVGGGATSGNPPSVSPVVDLAGGFFVLVGGAGGIKDNSLTDSVGGGFAFLRAMDDNFNGVVNSAENFNFPALTPGSFSVNVEARPRRFIEDLGGAPVGPADSPWNAFYNELVPADPDGGGIAAVEVIAPSAFTWGEQFSVKDFLGNADALNTILISAQPGETLDGAASESITTPFGSRTYISNGYGTWMLTATANI